MRRSTFFDHDGNVQPIWIILAAICGAFGFFTALAMIISADNVAQSTDIKDGLTLQRFVDQENNVVCYWNSSGGTPFCLKL